MDKEIKDQEINVTFLVENEKVVISLNEIKTTAFTSLKEAVTWFDEYIVTDYGCNIIYSTKTDNSVNTLLLVNDERQLIWFINYEGDGTGFMLSSPRFLNFSKAFDWLYSQFDSDTLKIKIAS